MEELKEKFLVKATASIAEIKEILKVHGKKKNRRSNTFSSVSGNARYYWFGYRN